MSKKNKRNNMLNLQQIENIIKPHKKNYEMRKHNTRDGYIFFFDNNFLDSRVELLNNEPDKLRLYLAKYYKVNYRWLEITIENNVIELKHYLDIEITQQDFIDFLLSIDFIKINKTNIYESKKIKKSENSNCYSFYSVDFDISNKIYKLSSFTKVSANNESALYGDCFMQGKDYWKLYNVIKNLEK